MGDSTNKTQAKNTKECMLMKKKNYISGKVSLSLEILIGNAKKDTLFQKIDWIDIAMLIYPIKYGQICIHRA